MAELAAIGLASNILQFVDIGYKLIKRVLEFADDANELPNSIRHLNDRLPLILYVLNHVGKWDANSITRASLLPIIAESRDCAQDLFDILEDIRPRPDSKSFKKAFKAVKSISKEDSIQKLVTILDKNIALLSAYQNLANTSAVQKLAKDSTTGFTLLTTDITLGFKHVLSDLQRTSLLNWIGQDAFGEYHQIHGTARLADTCNWIWHRKQFLDWQEVAPVHSGGRYLWIHGSSGMGKTFLAARIFEDMSKSHHGNVFAYFCRHENKGHFSTQILRSLLSRMIIADKTNAALELAHPFFQTRRSPTADYDELWGMLQAIISSADKYTFVIDGLDEYIRTETDDLLDNNPMPSETLLPSFLQRLVQATASAACRVLIVSRDHREIRLALGRAQKSPTASVTEYEIQESDLRADALLLARHIVNTRLPKQDLALRDELAQSIAEKSAGQMLWVRLQEQILKPSFKDKKLRQLVQNVPIGLRDTYDKQVLAMIKLPFADRDRAQRLLRWVLFARDSVTIHLLIEAILVDISSPDNTFSDDDLPRDLNEEDVSDEIKQLCQFVDFRRTSLEQEQRHWVVTFPHASRKDHLLSIDDDYHVPELQGLRFADREYQESILTQTCLYFLSLTNVWSSPESEDTDLKEVVDHRPFLRYAILNWPYHAMYGISEEECCIAVANFCAVNNMAWCRWRDSFEALTEESSQGEAPQFQPGNRMYYACEFGYVSLIRELLKDAENPTKPCGRKGSPMHAAIAHGNAEIIKMLLDHTQDLDVRNLQGETLIQSIITSASASLGSVHSTTGGDHFAGNIFRRASSFPLTCDERRDIISILLDSGSEITATDKAGWTSINKAAAKGQLEVVELLAERGADVNEPNNDLRTPINSAADIGHEEVVELLVHYSADIFKPDKEGMTPVHVAAAKGHLEVVELLIKHGADIGMVNGVGWTPTHSAAAGGYTEVVELLIRSGANLVSADSSVSTPVWLAAEGGHKAVIEVLLQYGADSQTPSSDGRTPFRAAVYKGYKEIVELLIQRGEDIHKTFSDKWTPVYEAATHGHKDILELLIRHRADVSVPYYKGNTALYSTAYGGYYEMAELLLQNGADVASCNEDGWSPLTAAAQRNHKETVEVLLRYGADVNIANPINGATPLYTAAGHGHREMVELLIRSGADVNPRNIHGWTAINLAVQANHLEVFKLLLEHGADLTLGCLDDSRTPFYIAIIYGRYAIVELLIHHGADVNSRNDNGFTHVNIAALAGQIEIVELLIQHGADIMAGTIQFNETPLHSAAHQGHRRIAELLIQHGADISARSKSDWTPLFCAADKGHLEVAKLLIQHGAAVDVNFANTNDRTPLISAALNGHLDIAELLLQHGADISFASTDTGTPLISAALSGHVDLVELLLQHGADLELSDVRDNETPLKVAAGIGHLEVVKCLLHHGADVNVRSKAGYTPLASAAYNGHVDVLELLLQNGADIDIVDNEISATPLYHAVSQGKTAAVELLLRYGANVSARNHLGGAPLLTATVYGHVEIAEILIRHGADIATAYERGPALITTAAALGFKAMVELLLRSGEMIDEIDPEGDTPLYSAVENGHHGEVLQFLMDQGADINLYDGYHVSSLFASLSCGCERLVEAQIARGSVLRIRDFRSIGSALAAALNKFSCNKIDLILGLIENEKWYLEALQELACLATERGLASDVRQKLIDAGASLQLPGVYGWTPAQCAEMCDTLRPQSGSPNSLPAPTQWSPFDNENVLQLLDNNREVLVQESARDVHMRRKIVVHADFFMPADRDGFYFEVTCLATGPLCWVAVGFSHWGSPVVNLLGLLPGAWAYHSDDGKTFAGSTPGTEYGPLYGPGDTIGCGVDFRERSAFFTKNGVHLGTAFTGLTGRLLPSCGVGSRGARLRVNFGDAPFVYLGPISSTEKATQT